jgi:hypothetical protein
MFRKFIQDYTVIIRFYLAGLRSSQQLWHNLTVVILTAIKYFAS